MSKKSNKLFAVFLFAAAFLLSDAIQILAFSNEPKTEIGREMRLEGKHTFKARFKNVNRKQAEQIVWTLDREEKPEDGGESVVIRRVASAQGKQAVFDLVKIPNKETVYRVRAELAGETNEFVVQVFPPNARSSFTYGSAGNPDVRTFIFIPASLSRKTKVIFVMHGQQRNAAAYLDSWTNWAGKNDYIALAPQFDVKNWEGARSYNLGNLFTNESGANTELKPAANQTFTIVENIHRLVRENFDIKNKQFDIWGHSAGAQFVHRFLFFKPAAPVRLAIAANAGWYTLPDLQTPFPYGWRQPKFSFNQADLTRYTRRPLVIMRAINDVEVDENVRTSEEANRQGRNRFERAKYMYETGLKLNPRSRWRLIDVPGAAHEQKKMAQAAQEMVLSD